MEIILKEDIIGLGFKNDIVNVKSGYGRNYLIPTGKGVIASESAKKVLAENLKQQAHKLAAIKAAAEQKAEAIKHLQFLPRWAQQALPMVRLQQLTWLRS